MGQRRFEDLQALSEERQVTPCYQNVNRLDIKKFYLRPQLNIT